MSFLTANILNEVAGYYNRMLINEAKNLVKIAQSMHKAHPDVSEEDLKLLASKVDPEYVHNRREVPDGQGGIKVIDNQQFGDYGVWALNMYVNGQLTLNGHNIDINNDEDCETLKHALTVYRNNKNNLGDTPLNAIGSVDELLQVTDGLSDERQVQKQKELGDDDVDIIGDDDGDDDPNTREQRLKASEEQVLGRTKTLDYAIDLVWKLKKEEGDPLYQDYTPKEYVVTRDDVNGGGCKADTTNPIISRHEGETLIHRGMYFIVVRPDTFEASNRLGGDAFDWGLVKDSWCGKNRAGWCTSKQSRYWDNYRRTNNDNGEANNGDYYIIFSKTAPDQMWQFHCESNQLMGLNNSRCGFSQMASGGADPNEVVAVFKQLGKDVDKNGWCNNLETVEKPKTMRQVIEELKAGLPINEIFNNCSQLSNSNYQVVTFQGHQNIVLENRRFLFHVKIDRWPSVISDMDNGMSIITSCAGKKNLLRNNDLSLVYNTMDMDAWFDNIEYVSNDLYKMIGAMPRRDGDGEVMHGDNGAIMLQNKYNFINVNTGEFIYNVRSKTQWLDYVGETIGNTCCIGIKTPEGDKYNYITGNGRKLIESNQLSDWLDFGTEFFYGKAVIGFGDKYNIINSNFEYALPLDNVEEWFDYANVDVNAKYAIVGRDDKYNLFGPNGLIWLAPIGAWFDDLGFDGENVDSEKIIKFENGFIPVYMYGEDDYLKMNYLSEDGRLAYNANPNQWFDRMSLPMSGYSIIMVYDNNDNAKVNVLFLQNGEILTPNIWYDRVLPSNGKHFRVTMNGREMFVTPDGQFYSLNGEPMNLMQNNGAQINENKLNYIIKNSIKNILK